MNISLDFVPEALQRFFAAHRRVALAFSGGCDSAYLMYAAAACGADVLACYVQSCFQPTFEYADACRLTEALGQRLVVLHADVLENENVSSNPPDRCYHCKQQIFETIIAHASEEGYDCVIDGTNASDDAGDRPGMRALAELGVLSPLRMCGIEKPRLRRLSEGAGLFTWNKPAYACLATRIPTGQVITAEALERIERAENALMDLGFADFRVRMDDAGARLELTEEQMPMLIAQRAEILRLLGDDFAQITLDLRPRKGLER